MRKITLLISFMVVTLVQAQVQDVWLTTRMDGTHDLGGGNLTTIWGYGWNSSGGITLPAPLLEFELGDSIHIHMINNSVESHTVHPHGLDVNQVNDGVPGTSFFIIAGDTGNYRFVADEPGTYLYHCHVTTTLHLTLGMYGMLSVNYPGNILYNGGPGYDKKYHFLASDLEEETNDAPLLAFPFHEIYPDHFMINGLAGSYLAGDPDNIITSDDGDKVLLRLGSMAYSKVVYKFPSGSNPTAYMSDGRALPASFIPSDLELYPGERYSVILEPDTGFMGQIEVEYYNMVNGSLIGTNLIAINRTDLGVDEPTSSTKAEALLIYPNPASELVRIKILENDELIQWFDPQGKLIATRQAKAGYAEFNLDHLKAGTYFVRSSRGVWAKLAVL